MRPPTTGCVNTLKHPLDGRLHYSNKGAGLVFQEAELPRR
jgi:hypothetical protein